MPVAVASAQANKSEREERLLAALKDNILQERKRKKEEYEAEVEEERQRKEREARERQDVMTLGETREQIQKLDLKLKELKNQKQQLFLQLKKVLNEDENRKKQQQQKESEIMAMHAMPPQNSQHASVYLPPRQQHPPIMQKGGPVGIGNQPMKRGRSPSPPLPQNYYKNAAYSQSSKHDERARANELGARVLWKQPQYSTPPGTLFYQTTSIPDSRQQPIIYPSYNPGLNMPLRQSYIELSQPPSSQAHPQKNDQPPKSAQVYHINVDQPPQQQQSGMGGGQSSQPGGSGPPSHKQQQQVNMDKIAQDRGNYHVEVKHEPTHQPPPSHLPDGVVYAPMIPGHPIHPGKWEMQMPPNQSQNAKTAGSITQGYPSRMPPGHNQPPPPQMQGQPQQQPPPPPQQIHYTRRMY